MNNKWVKYNVDNVQIIKTTSRKLSKHLFLLFVDYQHGLLPVFNLLYFHIRFLSIYSALCIDVIMCKNILGVNIVEGKCSGTKWSLRGKYFNIVMASRSIFMTFMQQTMFTFSRRSKKLMHLKKQKVLHFPI